MSIDDDSDEVSKRAEPLVQRPSNAEDLLLDVRVVISRDDQSTIGATFGPSVDSAADQIELVRSAARLLTESADSRERHRRDL